MEYTLSNNKTKELNSYMQTYGSLYNNDERVKLKLLIEEYISSGYISDVSAMQQVLAYTHCFSVDENPYIRFINYFKTRYDIYGNILIVGAGQNPIEAEYMNEIQLQTGKGTITVMEPNLRIMRSKRINYIKREFTEYTDLTMYDTIFAFKARETALPIILGCNSQRKPFCMGVSNDPYYQDDDVNGDTISSRREKLCKEANKTIQGGTIYTEEVNEPNSKYFLIRSKYDKGQRLN